MTKIMKALEGKIPADMQDEWFPIFSKHAVYLGNHIYKIGRLHSTDTRELFLMFVADMEDIDYEGKVEEQVDEVE